MDAIDPHRPATRFVWFSPSPRGVLPALVLVAGLAANEFTEPALLNLGRELQIPATDGAAYTMRPGDSLCEVAERFDVPLDTLLAVNDVADPDRVAAGMVLVVPGVEAVAMVGATGNGDGTLVAASVAQSVPLPSPSSVVPDAVTYTVQSGDTLATLGPKFGGDLQTLLATLRNTLSPQRGAYLFPCGRRPRRGRATWRAGEFGRCVVRRTWRSPPWPVIVEAPLTTAGGGGCGS